MQYSETSYEAVASEYYDPDKHPTCADFRNATRMLLDLFLAEQRAAPGPALELGAGKSLVAERFAALNWPLMGLTLTDASAASLAYSADWAQRGAKMATGSIAQLDLGPAAFDMIFACLGDPYNDALLWRRIAFWLKPDGRCFYTTPSFEWAEHYRSVNQPGAADSAAFVVDRAVIHLPSYVMPIAAQSALIAEAGLRVVKVTSVSRQTLLPPARSPKLKLPGITMTMPIVTAYAVEHRT